MAKPRDDCQKDLLRPALEDIIDLGHPLTRLAREIDWRFLDSRFASVCAPGAGQPGLPTRLVDLAQRHKVPLRQSYRRVAKRAAIMVGATPTRTSSSERGANSNSCAPASAG